MKKIAVALLALLFIIICFSMTASSIKVWPGSHSITIHEWYSPGDTVDRPTIQVINTESYDITIKISLDNPGKKTIKEGYSYIPDLSWIKTYPEELNIPAGSSRTFEVSIEVPDSEQSSLYNERWEAWVIVTPPAKPGGGINIQIEIAIKLFIKTPEGEVAAIPSIYIFIFIIISIIFIFITLYYRERKKRDATIYYFKNKK